MPGASNIRTLGSGQCAFPRVSRLSICAGLPDGDRGRRSPGVLVNLGGILACRLFRDFGRRSQAVVCMAEPGRALRAERDFSMRVEAAFVERSFRWKGGSR